MIYAVSDLHIGDGGPRDNFAVGTHRQDFAEFLVMVANKRGQLVICGDLFEFWQANLSKVLKQNEFLLDWLADLKAIYIPGNHDADLKYFGGSMRLTHPFFDRMVDKHVATVGGRQFLFIHGHEADPYCAGDSPGLGRITAIYTGLKEDKNGSPFHKTSTVESRVLGPWERMASILGRLRGEPSRYVGINRKLADLRLPYINAVVCGHMHAPGHIGDWLYNCGTWAEQVNSYVRINDDGSAGAYDWLHNTPINTVLPI